MRADPERDRAFEIFVRSGFRCVVNKASCEGPVEFSHLKHAGMGSKKVPSLGNGVPKCYGHHQGGCEAYHRIGRQTFETIHGLDLQAIARWLVREFEGDFLLLAEEPPKGVYRR